MVNINTSYTAPINPPSVSPTLTHSQCWQGLQLKIRNAPLFVGAIKTCTVLSEDKESQTVERIVTFAADPDKEVRESCRSFGDMKVDFHQTDGSVISNIISEGPKGGEEGDLYMTYAFQWIHPDVAEGSAEEAELRKKHRAVAKMAVDKSIEAIRRLVKEGEIA